MGQRIGHGDVRPAGADADDKLHLMVQLLALRRIRHIRVVQQQRVGRLHEEERRLPVRIAAHFPRVLGVVAADAKDTADGKGAAARNRNRRLSAGGAMT